jgi:PAS domain S-box-containing protein
MVAREIEALRRSLTSVSDPAGVLANLIAFSSEALAVYDRDGRRVLANEAWRDLFGRDADPDLDIREDPDLARNGVLFWLRRAFAGETVAAPDFWFDRRGARADGERRRVALAARAFPVQQSDGAVELVAFAFRDDTDALLLEQRRNRETEELRRLLDDNALADQERRASEELFRAVFEQCSDGVIITDNLGRTLDINPAGCRILCRTREEMIGEPYWAQMTDVGESVELSRRLLVEGRLDVESYLRVPSGELREIELRSVASFLPGRHLTTFNDVTQRNAAVRALEASQRHLMASQRIAHVGSWEYEVQQTDDLGANPLRGSDECFRIYGYEPGEVALTVTAFLRRVHSEDRMGLIECLRHAIENREIYSYEHRIRRADGVDRIVHSRGEILYDERTGMPVRLIGTTQDVTERSRVRRQIQQLNAELEQRVEERTAELATANRDLQAFAYSVSHDLRAPLRTINGFSRMLRSEHGQALGEDGVGVVERIERGARRMDKLIEDLLAFSRLGRAQLERATVDMNELVREVLEELSAQRTGESPEVVVRDLPGCHGDAGLLKQVWANLIGNAFKFSRNAHPARIEIGARREGEADLWYVRDNGVGFDMRHAERMFGVFQRLHHERDYEGTGVGLALVERIVERHGGRIRAEGALDEGATFAFTLGG